MSAQNMTPNAHVLMPFFERAGRAMLNVDEAASALGVGRGYLERLCDDGLIKYGRYGKDRKRFTMAQLLAYLDDPKSPDADAQEDAPCRSTAARAPSSTNTISGSQISDFGEVLAKRQSEKLDAPNPRSKRKLAKR